MKARQACALAGMDIKAVLAANMRRLRREIGMSQEQLAHLAGVDRTYVSSLERCVYAASIDVVDRLATVLGVEPSALLQRPGGAGTGADGGARDGAEGAEGPPTGRGRT